MPIYQFYCNNCKLEFKQILSMDERISDCNKCGENCERKIPTSTTIKTSSSNNSPGQRVEKFIEESREALQEQMKESRKDYK